MMTNLKYVHDCSQTRSCYNSPKLPQEHRISSVIDFYDMATLDNQLEPANES